MVEEQCARTWPLTILSWRGCRGRRLVSLRALPGGNAEPDGDLIGHQEACEPAREARPAQEDRRRQGEEPGREGGREEADLRMTPSSSRLLVYCISKLSCARGTIVVQGLGPLGYSPILISTFCFAEKCVSLTPATSKASATRRLFITGCHPSVGNVELRNVFKLDGSHRDARAA